MFEWISFVNKFSVTNKDENRIWRDDSSGNYIVECRYMLHPIYLFMILNNQIQSFVKKGDRNSVKNKNSEYIEKCYTDVTPLYWCS